MRLSPAACIEPHRPTPTDLSAVSALCSAACASSSVRLPLPLYLQLHTRSPYSFSFRVYSSYVWHTSFVALTTQTCGPRGWRARCGGGGRAGAGVRRRRSRRGVRGL